MLTKSSASVGRRTLILAAFLAVAPSSFLVWAQDRRPDSSAEPLAIAQPVKTTESSPLKKPETTEEKLSLLEVMLEKQNQRLDQMQQTISEQQEVIRLLVGKLNAAPTTTAVAIESRTEPGPRPTQSRRPTIVEKVESRISMGAWIQRAISLRSELSSDSLTAWPIAPTPRSWATS